MVTFWKVAKFALFQISSALMNIGTCFWCMYKCFLVWAVDWLYFTDNRVARSMKTQLAHPVPGCDFHASSWSPCFFYGWLRVEAQKIKKFCVRCGERETHVVVTKTKLFPYRLLEGMGMHTNIFSSAYLVGVKHYVSETRLHSKTKHFWAIFEFSGISGIFRNLRNVFRNSQEFFQESSGMRQKICGDLCPNALGVKKMDPIFWENK